MHYDVRSVDSMNSSG
ncbi:hypothetical protein Ccrd_015781 [Cynara cardunculus var. scolymus]|uniref:Uncharacterized protein n=1 Tax=Cynara cardunculus var. scolymus TaxID=59895 RepID=A0A103YB89_CYNCS|nr:hypothetical protein Ccrd_015781 [Cynara cardunculus var. scolymus]